MPSLALRLFAFFGGFSAVLLVGIAQTPAERAYDEVPQAEVEMTPRELWESLSPEERQRVRQRFDKLKKLDEGEREELVRRARKREEVRNDLLKELPDDARQRLAKAPRDRRRVLIDEMVEDEMRQRGRKIEARLPDQTREKLAAASPEERRRLLESFKRETRERISLVVVEDTAQALGYSREDIGRFMKLPIERRMKLVLELRKEFNAQQVAASGLPEGLSQQRWKELDRLPPRQYFAEVIRLRDEGLFGPPRRGEHPGGRGSAEANERARRITRSLRPDPQERLELSDLPPHRRRAILDQRRRERVLTELRHLEGLDAKVLESFEAMPDDEFFFSARRVVQRLRKGEAPGLRGGEGRERGELERGEGRERPPERGGDR